MEPFYFRSGDRQVFGIYHPPTQHARDEAALICPPIFGEYLRSHGCLRRLALSVAATGRHVLRFDYSGTGDSCGQFSESTMSIWRDDVRAALDELQAISGTRRVRVVGVRFGATIAVPVALDSPVVDRIVLWDPVTDGATYLSQLRATHERLLAAHVAPRPPEAPLPAAGELVGFSVSDELLGELENARLPDWSVLHAARQQCVLVSSRGGMPNPEEARVAREAGIDTVDVDVDCDWATYTESVLFPHAIVDELKEALS